MALNTQTGVFTPSNGLFDGAEPFRQAHEANLDVSHEHFDGTLGDLKSVIEILVKQGLVSPTKNMKMGTHRHVNVGDAQALNEYLTYKQALLGQANFIPTANVVQTDNSFALTIPADGTFAYGAGAALVFAVSSSITGSVSVNVNSVGEKNVLKAGSSGLVAMEEGDWITGQLVIIRYDGDRFQTVVSGGGATPASESSWRYFTGSEVDKSENLITLSPVEPLTVLNEGDVFSFLLPSAITGNVGLAVSSLPSKSVHKRGAEELSLDDWNVAQLVSVMYIAGDKFQALSVNTTDAISNQSGGSLKFWSGSQASYDSLTKDPNTVYITA